ncbi:ribitol-5-phosphate transferase FKTN-like [Lycorma delicatula]|uniref:ribitol-5-phosphate transferase FKTN-like n=1 Tax=Lycorma delicatula TaxID=130591 RepID=UPI003F51A82D
MLNRKLRCYRMKSSRSAIDIFVISGLLLLLFQLSTFVIILYVSENDFQWSLYNSESVFTDPIDDLDIIKQVFADFGMSLIIIDESFLSLLEINKDYHRSLSLAECEVCKYLKHQTLHFAVDKIVEKQVLDGFRSLRFYVTEFRNIKPEIVNTDLNEGITIGYLLKRYSSFFIVVLHRREDNVWWFGNIKSDTRCKEKLSVAGLSFASVNHIPSAKHEGMLNKFETVGKELSGTHLDFLFPKNVSKFLMESRSSKFKECDWKLAKKFEKQHGRRQSASALRFRHRAWKLLAKAKSVFELIGIEFWLNSGTLLGYVRECGIISYSKDVDIGVMAESYTETLHSSMTLHGFHLLIQLGKPQDSFELSFTDKSGIKLDIFFFYKNPNGSFWNGGTQVKSGRKFKYTFPPFELCWTIFQGLKVRIPCNTEQYIEANYGPDWFTPVTEWDWKTSPFNVQPNGQWPEEEWPQVIQVYQ